MVSISRRRKPYWAAESGVKTLFAFIGSCILCFYGGYFVGTSSVKSHLGLSEKYFQQLVNEEVKKVTLELSKGRMADDTANRFPGTVTGFAAGSGRINRVHFAEEFDMGVPLDPSSEKNKEVLIIYGNDKALPNDPFAAKEAISQTALPLMSADVATENCDYMNVVLTDHSPGRRQCVALFGQYEAFHIQKWMRLPEHGKLDASHPLRLVNRGAQASGRKSTKSPTQEDTLKYWSILSKYIDGLHDVLAKLRPIAESVAVNNSIVLLVCNFGQSELLLNFICSARSRGIDLSSVLVFATDQETLELAQALGVKAFYDEANFGSMPKEAAGRYADSTFTNMMLAKVYCVQMISMLGYDVLFQDVDIVWYRNPLDFFHDDTNPYANFDVYFQDDGNHGLFYAPYSANTGFYYIRNNEKTQHFFNSFLTAGDLILSTHSHQVPLVALLSEHASMYGMKVKIFSRTENDFPGGHAFHRRKDFMKDIIAGVEHPYIFHMSWTHNKDNKIRFFQQLGDWHVNDQCIQQTVEAIGNTGSLADACCLTEPIVKCHYRDKPSKIPCTDSPPIDQGRPSFW